MATRRITKVIIFTLILIISISGCTSRITNTNADTDENSTSCLNQIYSCRIKGTPYQEYIMCDSETSVLYMYFSDYVENRFYDYTSFGRHFSIIPLYNVDSSPRTYEDLTRFSPLAILSRGKILGTSYEQITMYDPTTLVMYMLLYDTFNFHYTVTPMYNCDGTLRIFSRFSTVDPLVLISSEEIKDSNYYQTILYDSTTLVMYMCMVDYFDNTFSGNFSISPMYKNGTSLRTYNGTNKISSLTIIPSKGNLWTRYKQSFAYDPDTLVMYMLTLDYINGDSNITVMYNSDGSVKKYFSNSKKINSLVMLSCEENISTCSNEILAYDPNTSAVYVYMWNKDIGGSAVTVMYNANGSIKSNN